MGTESPLPDGGQGQGSLPLSPPPSTVLNPPAPPRVLSSASTSSWQWTTWLPPLEPFAMLTSKRWREVIVANSPPHHRHTQHYGYHGNSLASAPHPLLLLCAPQLAQSLHPLALLISLSTQLAISLIPPPSPAAVEEWPSVVTSARWTTRVECSVELTLRTVREMTRLTLELMVLLPSPPPPPPLPLPSSLPSSAWQLPRAQ
jgi:hypothetical protein